MQTQASPEIISIKKRRGIAGQYALDAEVQYPGEPAETYGFVANTSGGPVVAISPGGRQVFVSGSVLDRLGRKVDETWVRGFFS